MSTNAATTTSPAWASLPRESYTIAQAANGWIVRYPDTYMEQGKSYVFGSRKAMLAWLSRRKGQRPAVRS